MAHVEKEEMECLRLGRNILESIADGIITVDKDMRVIACNQAAADITGFSREEAIGRLCYEIMPTEVCRADPPLFEALAERKPVLNREVYIVDKHGKRNLVSVSVSMLYDERGGVAGGVATIRNLKDFSTILDSVADGVFTVDDNLLIQSFNRAAEELTGFSHEEAIGRPCYEIFRSDACSVSCPVKEAVETGESVLNREVEIIDRYNNKKPISVSASVLIDNNGRARGGVETMRDLSMLYNLKRELHQKYTFHDMVSRNPSMMRLFNVLEDIAGSEATVLLNGESGTGKELFARAIHEISSRRAGPLVTINCGAFPETLLEAEIFGVRKGAYTGAVENRLGRLELCRGGTFFLDEIGDLPLPLQVKLLRVLENREFQPLGAKKPMQADVRFIAATHRNLDEMVEKGTFRRDLYFRINIVKVTIPPLRDRKEDIPMLLDIALARFNASYGKKVQRVSPEVLKLLLHYDFPGNVRELLNVIEQAVILCKGHEIGADLMPKEFGCRAGQGKTARKRTGRAPESSVLYEVLSRHKGDRAGAAEELGIDRSTLWRWMKNAGIDDV